MKKIVLTVTTLAIILAVNWAAAAMFNNNFMDWAFVSGLAVTIFIGFFTSSGGFMSDLTDSRLQSANNGSAIGLRTKIDRQKRSFRASTSFYVALSYTVIAGISSFIYYKDFFIN